MKRLFAVVPAILLVIFLINSFVLKEKEAGEKTKIVFKSTDGGQTWQDISKGLPENLQKDSIRGNSFFANDKGLFLKFENGLCHSTPNATAAPFWTKETFTDENSSIAPVMSGIVAYNHWALNLKNSNGTSLWSPIFDVWSPIFENFQLRIRSTFETAGGTIFIGTDRGLFRSIDNGKTWKHVYAGGWAGHMAELDGVLVSTSKRNIIRSTNNGENWALAISEDSVVFDVKQIKGRFAAITSNSELNTPKTSRLSTSYDGGKTWQPINAGDKVLIDSIGRTWDDRPFLQAFMPYIFQVGENFVCVDPEGLFRSSDKGKTWKLLLPAVENKIFNLFISGTVIYAIPSKGGC